MTPVLTETMDRHSTGYAEVDAVLAELLDGVREILGSRFVGLYLDGSLAIGCFAPDRSDIDFLVVTDNDLPDEMVARLAAMHARLFTSSPWGAELEGSYIPRRALRRFDRADRQHPYIDRGSSRLAVELHDVDWVVHRHVLREHGVAVVGPELRTLIDPVSPDDLRDAVRELLQGWWAPAPGCRQQLDNPFYRSYAVLTMCRMLYTLRHGIVVSKPVAAQWAETALDPRWAHLLDAARAWSRENAPGLDETLQFIQYTRQASER